MSKASLLPLLDQEYQSTHPFRTIHLLLQVPGWRLPVYWLLFLVKSSATRLLPLYREQMVRYANNPSSFPYWWFYALNGGYLFLLFQKTFIIYFPIIMNTKTLSLFLSPFVLLIFPFIELSSNTSAFFFFSHEYIILAFSSISFYFIFAIGYYLQEFKHKFELFCYYTLSLSFIL